MHGTCIGGVAQHCLTEQAVPGCPCRAGQAAKEGLVPPRQLRRDGLGSSQASPSALPIDNAGTSPKLGMMEVGGHMEFRGFVEKNAVMFVCSLGLQNFPSGSTPSTPAGFGGVTPFYNRTLIPLALRKHKGNPQNNQTGAGKSLQPLQKLSPTSRSKFGSLLTAAQPLCRLPLLPPLRILRHCGQLQSNGGFSIQFLSPFPEFSRLQAKGGQTPLPQGSGS